MTALAWTAVFYLVATSSSVGKLVFGEGAIAVRRVQPDVFHPVILAGMALAMGIWLCRRSSDKKSTRICPKCNRVKLDDGQIRCDCGDCYFALCEMEWEDHRFPSFHRPAPIDRLPAPLSKVNVIELTKFKLAEADERRHRERALDF